MQHTRQGLMLCCPDLPVQRVSMDQEQGGSAPVKIVSHMEMVNVHVVTLQARAGTPSSLAKSWIAAICAAGEASLLPIVLNEK